MVPWKGRLFFKQYIPGKAHKYGVKIYKLTATNGYIWYFRIYADKQNLTAGLGHAHTVVLDLTDAESLLQNGIYLIWTLRSNRAGSGHDTVQKKLKHDEVYGLQSNDGIKLIKWKDKRDVLIISTKPSHSATLVDNEKTNKSNERITKPQVVLDYNQEKQGTDLSDQLSTYYTCLRRSKE